MNLVQIEALAQLLSTRLEIPVIGADTPRGDEPLSSRPPRPYCTVRPLVSPAVGQVQKYMGDDERHLVQDYEPQISFQIFDVGDWEAQERAKKLKLLMTTTEAQLLMQEHGFAYLRQASQTDNTQVRNDSWVGRADLDLVFSSSTSYTEAIETIDGFGVQFEMKEPDTEFTVQITE